jgi:hypothetical protein
LSRAPKLRVDHISAELSGDNEQSVFNADFFAGVGVVVATAGSYEKRRFDRKNYILTFNTLNRGKGQGCQIVLDSTYNNWKNMYPKVIFKRHQHFKFQGLLKYTKIEIFVLKKTLWQPCSQSYDF